MNISAHRKLMIKQTSKFGSALFSYAKHCKTICKRKYEHIGNWLVPCSQFLLRFADELTCDIFLQSIPGLRTPSGPTSASNLNKHLIRHSFMFFLFRHQINGHFRNLNWRYLPYIRPFFGPM